MSTRPNGIVIALASAVVALFAFAPIASADIDGTKTAASGTSDTRAGAHGTLTVGGNFTYSAASEDLKRVVIDFPAGGVGNPNAVPYADRCTTTQFETSTCPAASQIGVVNLKVLASDPITGLPLTTLDLSGTISIIQTTPEVPTVVGAYVTSSLSDPIRAYATFYPVTSGPDGDFRVRAETNDFPRTAHTPLGELPIQIQKYEQVLWGELPSGVAFITNPPRCDTWMSYAYFEAWDETSNADSDPLQTGTNTFKKIEPVPTEPDCSTPNDFNTNATASLSSVARGGSPTFTTTLSIPNLEAKPLGPSIPKTVVATLPDGVNVDVQQLSPVCEVAQFEAMSCPAASQVGTVDIKTPMIVAGLHGEAYLVRPGGGRTLPDLGLVVRGAINFTQIGSNKYVGNGTVLQSTFDNIPQVGFSEFKLTITGGPGGLLRVDTCPASGQTPNDSGPVSFAMTSYEGQSRTVASPSFNFGPCATLAFSLKAIKKCLRSKRLKISPNYKSRDQIRQVKVSIRGQKTKTFKRSPFRINMKLSKKLKAGKKYRYTVRVYYKPSAQYPKGKVVKKTGSFKLCK